MKKELFIEFTKILKDQRIICELASIKDASMNEVITTLLDLRDEEIREILSIENKSLQIALIYLILTKDSLTEEIINFIETNINNKNESILYALKVIETFRNLNRLSECIDFANVVLSAKEECIGRSGDCRFSDRAGA